MQSASKSFYERHAWKILLRVILMIGFLGIGDMFDGASNLQNGEKVYMTGVTGMTWNELQAASPTVARMIDTIFRTNGATLATLALLSLLALRREPGIESRQAGQADID